MSDSSFSPIKQARRSKIIDAAEHLFVTDGYRAVTMEGVARSVGMSKVTVYAYFRDKDALFDAVTSAIASDMQHAFDTALAGDGTIGDRIIASLIAKHAVVHHRVRKSRFASELFAVKNRANAARFQKLDLGFAAQIADALSSNGFAARDAQTLADVLFASSQGIANAADSPAQMAAQIGMLSSLISDCDYPPK